MMAKTLLTAGHIPAKKRRQDCANGCIGPFRRRPDMDANIRELFEAAGITIGWVPPQYDCLNCFTTRSYTPRELRGRR